MFNYEKFSPESMEIINNLNKKLIEEENKEQKDNYKINKLKESILIKGMQSFVGFNF